MKKQFFIWYFEQNKPYIPIEEAKETFNSEYEEVIKQVTPFFDVHSKFGISLKPRYALGILDVKRSLAFLLQDPKDLKLELRDLNHALNKDLVLVEKFPKYNKVIEVIRSSLIQIIATVRKTKNYTRFAADRNLDKFISVADIPNYLVDGHVVLLRVEQVTTNNVICSVEAIIGHKNDPDIDILRIVYGYNWPLKFSEEVLNEVSNIKVDHDYEKQTRRSLVNDLIVTIDGEDAKDLDDAISIFKKDGHYHIGVHIADVSYFVKDGSLLDQEAYNRATSSYLVDRVIPMIPHGLSNDLCSLNPDEIKYTMTCQIELDPNYEVVDYQIFASYIQSKQRLTYDQVNKLVHDGVSVGSKEVDQMLVIANEVGLGLKKKRSARGAIDFHSSELEFEIDPITQKILAVSERETDQAEGLIESFMILANEVVATHFIKHNLPGIYRIHETPDVDKLQTALETVAKLGFVANNNSIAKTLQILTNKSVGTNYEYIVNMTLLRAMQKAKYSENPLGHFGLASKYYSHFTSPIRRYPDLLLHRMIRDMVLVKAPKKKITYYTSILHMYAEHSSIQERKAISMERDVNALKSAEYMEDKIGEVFDATIVSLTQSGLFVKLTNGIEGFIALRNINQYLAYDDTKLSYYNREGKTYRLGDKIKVELIDVDKLERQITFTFAELKGMKTNENFNSKQESQPRLLHRDQVRGGNSIKGKRSKINSRRKNKSK